MCINFDESKVNKQKREKDQRPFSIVKHTFHPFTKHKQTRRDSVVKKKEKQP